MSHERLHGKLELKTSFSIARLARSQKENYAFLQDGHSQFSTFSFVLSTSAISEIFSQLNVLWTRDLQVVQGIPFRGLFSL